MKKYLIFIGLTMLGFSCQSEDAGNTDESSPGIIPNSIEQIADVIELKYGEEKEWNYNGQVFKFTITDVEDKMLPCALIYFGDEEAYNRVKIHTSIRMETVNQRLQLKVSSRACGIYEYKNDDTDIQYVWDLLELWHSAPANEEFPYFRQEFSRNLGTGTQVENTPFSIFMVKANPLAYQSGYNVENSKYKFIFIITEN
jgi:hypothetical protein